MRRYIDILTERSERIPFRLSNGSEIDVMLHWNPTPMQASNLVKRTHFMRGIIVGKDVAFWDAHDVIHHHMGEQLGIPRVSHRLYLVFDGKTPLPRIVGGNIDDSIPPLRRMIDSGLFEPI